MGRVSDVVLHCNIPPNRQNVTVTCLGFAQVHKVKKLQIKIGISKSNVLRVSINFIRPVDFFFPHKNSPFTAFLPIAKNSKRIKHASTRANVILTHEIKK